jgi:DNA-binding CsgD family transcriptional regulator
MPDPERAMQCLLDALYEAAVDSSRWVDFLNQLTRTAGGDSAALVLHDFENASSSVAQQFGLSSNGTHLYAQHYYKLDVWTSRARELRTPVLITTSEQLCPWNEFLRTEYYNDFLRPNGIAHGAFSVVKSSDSHITSLSIYKGHKGEFTDAELEILQFVTPHVRRAFRVHSEFSRLRTEANDWNAALDAVATPILLLGNRGTVIGMNAAAASLVSKRDGLLLTRDGISAERPAEAQTMHHLLKQVTVPQPNGAWKSAGALKVSRRSGTPLNVVISATPRNSDFVADHRVLALVFVNDPDQRPVPMPSVLQMLYGLTGAEARVALLLAEGQDLRGACGELSITYATARAHLRNIFQKCGVRRQAELSSILIRLAGPLFDSTARNNLLA